MHARGPAFYSGGATHDGSQFGIVDCSQRHQVGEYRGVLEHAPGAVLEIRRHDCRHVRAALQPDGGLAELLGLAGKEKDATRLEIGQCVRPLRFGAAHVQNRMQHLPELLIKVKRVQGLFNPGVLQIFCQHFVVLLVQFLSFAPSRFDKLVSRVFYVIP